MAQTAGRRRVVITGLGAITPLGNTVEELWQALESGASGVRELSTLPAEALPMSFAAEAREFTGHIDNFGPLEKDHSRAIRKALKMMCRECQMGVAAGQRAIRDAHLAAGAYPPERIGVVFGSDYMLSPPVDLADGFGVCTDPQKGFEMRRWGGEGMGKMEPLWLLKYLPNMPACHLAIYNDYRGPSNSLTLREASSGAAIGEALRTIGRGSADLVLAGATGTRLHPMKTLHVVQQEEVAANNGRAPQQMARPFDRDRTGMVLGEGAGVVVVEDAQTAQARGVRIYAELAGAGSSSVLSPNHVARRAKALENAMRAALRDAGISPDQIGHVQAHGLGTRTCDIEEATAVRAVFGDRPVPVTSAKSYFGNLGAGSGAAEVVAGVLALAHDKLFPLLNYETADPECPINAAREGTSPGDSFIALSVTPQGQATAVVVRKWRE